MCRKSGYTRGIRRWNEWCLIPGVGQMKYRDLDAGTVFIGVLGGLLSPHWCIQQVGGHLWVKARVFSTW